MFTSYEPTFDPEALRVLQDAFDRAWLEASTMPRTLDGKAVRDMIAVRVVTAWRDQGVRDPEQLKRLALVGLPA
jgi:hypothetical protein